MRITKFSFIAVSSSLLLLSPMLWAETNSSSVHQHDHSSMVMPTETEMPSSNTTSAPATIQPQPAASVAAGPDDDHALHIKEHGGQIYQATTVESRWLWNEDGEGALKSELETRIGTDENKLFIKLHSDKAESHRAESEAKVLYSRMISDFWDAQAGVRYRNDPNRQVDENQLDAVVGLHGMAPYFFETDAYVYAGQDQQWSFSLETERDLLLTQKLILKPYLDLDIVFSDDSKYAKKTGLSSIASGLETRYEISKQIMPFIDVSYEYQKGNEATAWQEGSDSEHGWLYGAGIRFKF
ncbi:copper resistance protein B [Acinetobacter zhairhuonensis]|uniref:copper resistance protein B n=1 Tax=Acinetobacter sp. A7.4 TaxID=2919921 RepID=UPI001F5031EA|nr:copper resistance protein B [Acinetobacter sp. A7.4]MCJ8163055.1 copper resistance protein B [Acinetobacter sp. A7.4]